MQDNKNNIQKQFVSCFICKVDIGDKYIILSDTSNRFEFIIDRANEAAMDSFTQWFKNSYMKCISQTMTIVDYSITYDDGSPVCFVNKLMFSAESV